MCSLEKLAYSAIHTVSVSDRNCWADSLRRLCVEMTGPVSRRDCESEFTNLSQLSLSLFCADALVDDNFVEKVLQWTLRCDQWLLFELLWRDLLTVGFDRGKSLGWYCQLEYHTLNVTSWSGERSWETDLGHYRNNLRRWRSPNDRKSQDPYVYQIITKSVQLEVHLGLWCLEMFHQGLLDPSTWIEERIYLCLGVVVYVYSHTKNCPKQ